MAYVDKVKCSCPEHYCQDDEAQIQASDLIPDIAEIVGFYRYPEDE